MGFWSWLFGSSPMIFKFTATDLALSWGSDNEKNFRAFFVGGAWTLRYKPASGSATAVLGLKVDHATAQALCGEMPVEFCFAHYVLPGGVVAAWGFRIHDNPKNPLACEHIFDPLHDESVAQLKLATRGPKLYMPIVNDSGVCVTTKLVPIGTQLAAACDSAVQDAIAAAKKHSSHIFRAAEFGYNNKFMPGHMFPKLNPNDCQREDGVKNEAPTAQPKKTNEKKAGEKSEATPTSSANPITLFCPHCTRPLTVPFKAAGTLVKCTHCSKQFMTPKHEVLKEKQPKKPGAKSGQEQLATPTPYVHSGTDAFLSNQIIELSCPHCKKPLTFRPQAAGKRRNCPSCHVEILVPDSASAPLIQSSEPPITKNSPTHQLELATQIQPISRDKCYQLAPNSSRFDTFPDQEVDWYATGDGRIIAKLVLDKVERSWLGFVWACNANGEFDDKWTSVAGEPYKVLAEVDARELIAKEIKKLASQLTSGLAEVNRSKEADQKHSVPATSPPRTSTIKYCCPHCKKVLTFAAHTAGKYAKCSGCTRAITIPKAAASAKDIKADDFKSIDRSTLAPKPKQSVGGGGRLVAASAATAKPARSEEKDERDWSAIPIAVLMIDAANSQRPDEALGLAKQLKDEMPDYYLSYWWAATIHASVGRLDKARAELEAGLQRSRTMVSLLAKGGTIEYEAGNTLVALEWWVKSVILQLDSGNMATHNPFLYLGYVAQYIGSHDVSSALLRRSDRIHSAAPRLSSEAASRLTSALNTVGKGEIKKALQLLNDRSL